MNDLVDAFTVGVAALVVGALLGFMGWVVVWTAQQPTCEERGGTQVQTGYAFVKIIMPVYECVMP